MNFHKNSNRSICAVKYPLYTVGCDQKSLNRYCYYLNAPWSENVGDRLIYKSKTKSIVLNKYTLPVLGILYSLFLSSIYYPLSLPFILIRYYLIGGKNFVMDKAWKQHEHYFNWCNIIIITGLLIYILL